MIRGRLTSYAGHSIGEQNTKVGLIGPLLRALGWDIEDLREVHLEYKRRPGDKPVDYALLINATPRLFVEAKSLGENLEDRKWANQIMGYATVAGVRWVVLTNGDEYRLYNSHASVPVEEKLFRTVRASDPGSAPEETLALLSKENIAQLEALWQEDFVDRQVEAALNGLFQPEPDAALVRLLRRRLPSEISPRDIRFALGRIRRTGTALQSSTRVGSSETPSAPAERPAGRAFGEGTPWSGITLGDVLSAGLIRPPTELFRRYKGNELRARIEADGRVSFGDQVYGSLSVAGMIARRTIIGQDRRAQTNGWTFWRFRGSDGTLHLMDELRQQLWSTRQERA
ncbi:MAG: type I restriction enzyme HsdR N-terminal domain-containing protein [Actinobacteria bacterium]|nr:type I restriction enzyme HsdR N-terminal domain-containing protein [Actinomycetota bacterium]